MDVKISVIVPLYNAEKFVGQCLDSLLAQTFVDFEVIVVDDCSTDASRAIVESYREKFGGRLTFLQLDRNSGSGAVPRNAGLKFARGEYIFFADADDLLTLTALEELHALAKNFDADVVYCERHYKASADLSKIVVDGKQRGNFVDRPTLETDDLAGRIDDMIRQEHCWVAPWNKFVRRSLLVEHEIFFPHCTIAEDTVWTYGLILFAKKFLRVPNVVYVYRYVQDSVIRTKRTPHQWVDFWFEPLPTGLKTLESFMSKLEFFRQKPQYRYDVLNSFVDSIINSCFEIFKCLEPFAVCEIFAQQLGKTFGEQSVLLAVLVTKLLTAKGLQTAEVKRLQS